MAASITFNINGNPQTVDVTNVAVRIQACYGLPNVFYQYFLRFMYTEDGVTFYDMTMRFYIESIARGRYEISNQAGMTSMDQIKNSRSLAVIGGRARSEMFHGESGFYVDVSSVAGSLMQATFEGSFSFYNTPVAIDPATGDIAYPAAATTLNVTDGVITDIPIV